MAGAGKPGPRPVAKPAASDADAGEPLEPPRGLPDDVRQVWKQLAPHAHAERTLTPRSALAFEILCRNITLERKLAASPLACAGPDHRGMLGRIEVGMIRFRLTPDGKPVEQVDVQDEWSQFDVIQGGKSA